MKSLIKTLLISLLIVFPFGQLTRISLFSGANLYIHDVIIVFILLIYLFQKPSFKSSLTPSLIYFTEACFLSLAANLFYLKPIELLVSSLYLLRFLAYCGLFFVIKNQPKTFKKTFKAGLLYTAVAVGLLGLTQYLFLPDTRFLRFSNWDDHYYRLLSGFLDPNYTGVILSLGLILWLFICKQSRLYWIFFLTLLLSLFLTYSRSSYLSILAAFISYAFVNRQRRFLWFVPLFLLVLVFLPRPGGEGVKLERVFSINQRWDNYQTALTIIKNKPVFGVGFNSLRYYRYQNLQPGKDWLQSHSDSGLDNSLLFVWATTGLLGLVTYLNLLKKIWPISTLIKISLIALLIHSFFQNSLFYPWVMLWLFTLSATEYS